MSENLTDPYKPLVRGRASICHWDLTFRFYTKEQCQKFIDLYLTEVEANCELTYNCIRGDSIELDNHYVTLEDGVWANNLTTVAKILERCDYSNDF